MNDLVFANLKLAGYNRHGHLFLLANVSAGDGINPAAGCTRLATSIACPGSWLPDF
jgi:hypothetical protein